MSGRGRDGKDFMVLSQKQYKQFEAWASWASDEMMYDEPGVEMGEPMMELRGHAGVNLSACMLAQKL